MFAMAFGSLNEIEKCQAQLNIFVFNVKRKHAFAGYLSLAY